MQQFARGLVSPGGAVPYAGVSRAAVHKAMREGRITVFAFHMIQERRGIFGSKLVRESPYLYIPVVELKAWRMELEDRLGTLQAKGVDGAAGLRITEAGVGGRQARLELAVHGQTSRRAALFAGNQKECRSETENH